MRGLRFSLFLVLIGVIPVTKFTVQVRRQDAVLLQLFRKSLRNLGRPTMPGGFVQEQLRGKFDRGTACPLNLKRRRRRRDTSPSRTESRWQQAQRIKRTVKHVGLGDDESGIESRSREFQDLGNFPRVNRM